MRCRRDLTAHGAVRLCRWYSCKRLRMIIWKCCVRLVWFEQQRTADSVLRECKRRDGRGDARRDRRGRGRNGRSCRLSHRKVSECTRAPCWGVREGPRRRSPRHDHRNKDLSVPATAAGVVTLACQHGAHLSPCLSTAWVCGQPQCEERHARCRDATLPAVMLARPPYAIPSGVLGVILFPHILSFHNDYLTP